MNFIERAIIWNAQRYTQEHKPELTAHLLYEECHEFDASTTDVERLDALGDIIYIAIGALWKMGLNEDQIDRIMHAICDSNASKSIEKTPSNMKANIDKGLNYFPPTEALLSILKEVEDERTRAD